MYLYNKHLTMTWEEFLTTKFGLGVDTYFDNMRHILSTDNTLHGISRALEKVAFYFKFKNQLKPRIMSYMPCVQS